MLKLLNLKERSNKVYQFRIQRELTQAECAKVLGVDQSQISRWESGVRVPTSILNLIKCLSIQSER